MASLLAHGNFAARSSSDIASAAFQASSNIPPMSGSAGGDEVVLGTGVDSDPDFADFFLRREAAQAQREMLRICTEGYSIAKTYLLKTPSEV